MLRMLPTGDDDPIKLEERTQCRAVDHGAFSEGLMELSSPGIWVLVRQFRIIVTNGKRPDVCIAQITTWIVQALVVPGSKREHEA